MPQSARFAGQHESRKNDLKIRGTIAMGRRKKIRVGVLFGGRSGEHEISMRSALTVMSAMDPARYEIVPIGIAHDGRWYYRPDAIAMLTQAAPKLRALGRSGIPITLLPHPGRHGLMMAPSANGDGAGGKAKSSLPHGPLDVIFPVLHGTYGEDGTVQGLLELAGVPYVGAGVLGSAIGMDKDAQKRVFREARIPVVAALTIRAGEGAANPFGYPVFVKPARLGSSVGISKVHDLGELQPAVE